jgi:predicted O-methyltransferase YrrM
VQHQRIERTAGRIQAAGRRLGPVGYVKRSLRKARAQGKFVGLISALAGIWYKAKFCRDYLRSGAVRHALLKERIDEKPEALVSFVMDRFGGSIAPIQNRWEITELVKRVQSLRPATVVEIGTARGGTLFLLCRSAATNAHVVSLDLPSGKNGGGFPVWKESIYRLFKKPAQRLDFIRANSHSQATVERLKKLLGGRMIDFLFIDGDHSYEGVKTDFEFYSPLVSPSGLIAFHDIMENKMDAEINVHRFWIEIRDKYKAEELAQGIGIGILTLNSGNELVAAGQPTRK